MSSLQKNEIVPGLAIYQKSSVLVTLPGTLTNADDNNVVNRNGPFLVLKRYDDQRWLCAPLYTEKEDKDDRLPIVKGDKYGHIGWTNPESFFSVYQFWAISDDDIIAAANGADFSRPNQRNFYTGDLNEIIGHEADSRVGYRHVSVLPPTI